jgi:hypothetical protein
MLGSIHVCLAHIFYAIYQPPTRFRCWAVRSRALAKLQSTSLLSLTFRLTA